MGCILIYLLEHDRVHREVTLKFKFNCLGSVVVHLTSQDRKLRAESSFCTDIESESTEASERIVSVQPDWPVVIES